MRYFYRTDEGDIHGPTDAATLARLIGDGKLSETCLLEEETSGRQLLAGMLTELALPEDSTGAAPPPYVSYPRKSGMVVPSRQRLGENSVAFNLRFAWICTLAGFLGCPILSIAGMVFARRAQAQGDRQAPVVALLSYVSVAVGSFVFLMFKLFFR